MNSWGEYNKEGGFKLQQKKIPSTQKPKYYFPEQWMI